MRLFSLPSLIHHLTPDETVSLLTLGLLLIFFELNRPGRIWAGSLGLLFALFAAAAFSAMDFRPAAICSLVAASGLLLLNLYRSLPSLALTAVPLATIAGLRWMVRPGAAGGVHSLPALLCGGLLGGTGALLTRIAYRARRAKALN